MPVSPRHRAYLVALLSVGVSETGFSVACGEGGIEVARVRPHDGGKVGAAEYAAQTGLEAGARLGS